LDIAEESFVETDRVDWQPIRDWALDMVQENPSTEGAYEAVGFALAALDTPHTGFIRPDAVEENDDQRTPGRVPPSGEGLEGGIGYLNLPGINLPDRAPEYAGEVRRIMERLENDAPVCGWILDLRDSIGGSSVGDWMALGPLVGDDLLMRFGKGGGGVQMVFYDDGVIRYENPGTAQPDVELDQRIPSDAYEPRRTDVPVAVLVSSRTASAGEAIAITFAGRPDTRFFGEKTAGATTSSEFHEMPDGAVLRIASGYYQDRTGRQYEDGVEPDTEIENIRDTVDQILNTAAEWLRETNSCGLS
jgi:C-terminal processing protease CtpA/Prc